MSEREEKEVVDSAQVAEEEEESADEDYKIEKVLSRRTRKDGKTEYRIRWEGYSPEDDTWECREDLVQDGYEAQVDEFDALNKEEPRKETTKSRKRSKTPNPRARQVDAGEEKEEEEEEEEEEETEPATQGTKEVPLAKPSGEEDDVDHLPEYFSTWLQYFVLLFFIHMTARSVEAHSTWKTAFDEESLKIIVSVTSMFPTVLNGYTLWMNMPVAEYSNYAMVVISWMLVVQIYELLITFQPPYEKGVPVGPVPIGAVLIDQLILIFLLFAREPANEEDHFTTNRILGITGVTGASFYLLRAYSGLAYSTLTVLSISMMIASILYFIFDQTVTMHPGSVSITFTGLGLVAFSIQVITLALKFEQAPEVLEWLDTTRSLILFGEVLSVPVVAIAHSFLVWASTAFFMLAGTILSPVKY